MSIHTVTVTAAHITAAADLLTFAATGSSAQMSPVISGVAVTVSNGQITLTATDRFTCGEYTGVIEDSTAEIPLLILPPDLLKTFVKSLPKTRGAAVTLEHDTDKHTVTLRHETAQQTAPVISGNYPAISRLYPETVDELSGVLLLNPHYLARLTKLRSPLTGAADKSAAWAFSGGAATSESGIARNPIMATITYAVDQHTFRVLVQPNRPPR
jgi:hypothetical protein